MDDLISRKWLVECLEEGWIKLDTEVDYNKMIHLIRDTAPSAQPEIILCKDCAWGMTGEFSKNFFCSRTGALTWAEPDSFCNYAERKKDV